jgi:hypothetical protein
MPLPWIRLDTAMPDNPKVLALVDLGDRGMAAAFVWTCSLAYSGKHGLDGFIPKNALSRINGRAPHVKLLLEYGLWKDEGIGWSINGWEDFQESTEETQKRSDKARNAAMKRWHPGEETS